MRRFFIFTVLFLVLPSVSLSAEDTVLAKIGDKKITMSDFNRMISYYDADKQKILEENPQYKAAILKRVVQGMVFSKIARDKGFDKRTDIIEQTDLLTNDLLATEYLKKEIIDKINVSEDDIKLYYKAHLDEFKTPEMVRARHILVRVDRSASEADKKKAREKADELLKRAKSGEDFAKLASEFSEDPGSKNKGGDLGFLQRGRMIPDFEMAAFSLKAGELSEIVETRYGLHIIKVEERKESVLEPYDKVKDRAREKVFNDLRKKSVEEAVEKAMKDAGVELNLDPFLPKDKK